MSPPQRHAGVTLRSLVIVAFFVDGRHRWPHRRSPEHHRHSCRPRRTAAPSVSLVRQGQAPAATPPPSIYDRIWRFAEWYRNDDARVIQRVQFTGRFQHDYALVWTRTRAITTSGTSAGCAWAGASRCFGRSCSTQRSSSTRRSTIRSTFGSPTSISSGAGTRALVITGGKQGVPFTSEGATSSRELIAIDRSNLANNIWFPQEYMPGSACRAA